MVCCHTLLDGWYPPLQAPADRRIIHFIHQYYQVLDTGCFSQHGVLPRLSTLLKTSFKLAFPGRDHLRVRHIHLVSAMKTEHRSEHRTKRIISE